MQSEPNLPVFSTVLIPPTQVQQETSAACPNFGCQTWKSPNHPHHQIKDQRRATFFDGPGRKDSHLCSVVAAMKKTAHFFAEKAICKYLQFETGAITKI
jgi:hypothetical protein